jgi:aspartyl-tRNA(Asn)/glutamyl-tRNA(Gln) amidotransferase subunit A
MLAHSGSEVVTGELFFDLDSANHIWRIISRAGVAFLMGWRNGALQAAAGPSVRSMAEDGRAFSASDYMDALEQVAALRLQLVDIFSDYDLVLTPTAAALPWPAGEAYPSVIDGRPAGPRDHAVFTGWVNIAGIPAVSLPVAISREGLPIGVQLVAGLDRDDELLAFAEGIGATSPLRPSLTHMVPLANTLEN